MNWAELKKIQCWTPLTTLRLKKQTIGKHLHRIGQNMYIYAHSGILVKTEARGPYVTMLLWAESDGAANRAMHQDIENDQHNLKAEPPAEMLYKNCLMFGELIRCLKSEDKYEPTTLTWSYRMDGKFVRTNVNIDNLEYNFRSLRGKKAETPFAIQYRLINHITPPQYGRPFPRPSVS